MAIEIEIPKDITKYESKLIGPLTTRQTVCLVPGIGLGILVFNVLKPYLSQEMLIGVVMITSLPFLLCGFYKPYSMPFEKFIKSVFISMFIAPAKRKYITVNVYDEINNLNNFPSKNNSKNKNINKNKKGKKDNVKTTNHLDFVAYK